MENLSIFEKALWTLLIWNLWFLDHQKKLDKMTSPIWWRQAYQRSQCSSFFCILMQVAVRWPVLADKSNVMFMIVCVRFKEMSCSYIKSAMIESHLWSVPCRYAGLARIFYWWILPMTIVRSSSVLYLFDNVAESLAF